jgi:hypothetical protein
MKGWVYIITNKAMPDLVKVGFSTKDPEKRADELYSTGVPHRYVVEYDALVDNPYGVEQKAHKLLKNYIENKEWFRCDIIKAVAAIREAAENTIIHESIKFPFNAVEQFNLGWNYANGSGVTKNLEQAVYWYKKAAEQGNAAAQCNLGVCYENGRGVERNLNQAVYWYEKSAEKGNATAQFNLGMAYVNGNGVEKDLNQAMYLCKKSAEKGHAKAQEYVTNLGFYPKEDNTKKIEINQNNVFKKPMERIRYSSFVSLVIVIFFTVLITYMMGNKNRAGKVEENRVTETKIKNSLEKNSNKFTDNKNGTMTLADLYKKSCDEGRAGGCYNLGLLYREGQDVKKDTQKALELYVKSCDMQEQIGCDAYAKLKNFMTEKNKLIDVMPKSIDWNSSVTLTGKYYLKKFKDCCFYGKEKTESYHHLQLSNSIDIIDNSGDIENIYDVKEVQIAKYSYIDSSSKKVNFLGIKNGDFITIRCENLWEGNTGHYALPVYCNNPTIISSNK